MRLAALAFAVAIFATGGPAPAQGAHPIFRWPVIGKAEPSPDGHGVDIEAPEGTAVHAAADGTVIYASGELASFGKMVVVRHAGDYVTSYAHLSDMAVGAGVAVKRGQIIGKSGGGEGDPQSTLHFELRKGETNLDPIGYLSAR